MDDWQYLEREVVTDPKGKRWTVALMDVLGQEGDPDMPNKMLELQYSSGRYFTLIYSATRSATVGTRLPVAARGNERLRRSARGRYRWKPRSLATGVPAGSGRLARRKPQPPDIAPTIRNGSFPATTSAGNRVPVGSCE